MARQPPTSHQNQIIPDFVRLFAKGRSGSDVILLEPTPKRRVHRNADLSSFIPTDEWSARHSTSSRPHSFPVPLFSRLPIKGAGTNRNGMERIGAECEW